MTSKPTNPPEEPWHKQSARVLAEYRRERTFTQDPPFKKGNPFRKGGPSYVPYPEDAQGNPIFFDPVDQNRVEDERDRLYEEQYKD